MLPIRYTKLFYIRKEKEKKESYLLMRIRWDNGELTLSLGVKVDADKWSNETQRCKNGTTHGDKKISAAMINRLITLYEDSVDNIFWQYEKEEEQPDKEALRSRILKIVRNEDTGEKPSFFKTFDIFVIETGAAKSWADSTYVKFQVLRRELEAFDKGITFEKMTEQGLNEFVSYMKNTEGLINSTMKKRLSMLKLFLKWSRTKGYHDNRDYETFSPKLREADNKVVFLDWDELMKVYDFEFPEDKRYLANARDVFCFQCFTSLRYSDVANLKWSDIHENHISVTTQKTSDSLIIELNDYSREILDRHRDKVYPKGKALPVQANQIMNRYLKEIGMLCGIDEPVKRTYYKGSEKIETVMPKYKFLGTHTGRRTFICNALMLGISPEIIMEWTGHSDYASMKPYIGVANSMKKKAMELFNKNDKKE